MLGTFGRSDGNVRIALSPGASSTLRGLEAQNIDDFRICLRRVERCFQIAFLKKGFWVQLGIPACSLEALLPSIWEEHLGTFSRYGSERVVGSSRVASWSNFWLFCNYLYVFLSPSPQLRWGERGRNSTPKNIATYRLNRPRGLRPNSVKN